MAYKAVTMKMPISTLFRKMLGSCLSVKGLLAGIFGNTTAKYASTSALTAHTQPKVWRQPSHSPTMRPSGNPTTMASADPVTTALTAMGPCFSSTTFTATGAAMAQNTEWAQATTKRAAISKP